MAFSPVSRLRYLGIHRKEHNDAGGICSKNLCLLFSRVGGNGFIFGYMLSFASLPLPVPLLLAGPLPTEGSCTYPLTLEHCAQLQPLLLATCHHPPRLRLGWGLEACLSLQTVLLGQVPAVRRGLRNCASSPRPLHTKASSGTRLQWNDTCTFNFCTMGMDLASVR